LIAMKLLSKVRHWVLGLAGKPQVQVEDYVLEHLLAYHGLIGSGAEGQPQFSELSAGIQHAVVNGSTAQLESALKVPPLWWDEHLKPTFEEIILSEPEKLKALLADPDQKNDLLASDDWRVRANAAYALALLSKHSSMQSSMTDIEQRLAKALNESTNEPFKAAFLHISYALGKLRTEPAKKALLEHLHDPEPWFRVDAIRSLTLFPADKVPGALLSSLLDHHLLLDYASMVIGRAYKMQELLEAAPVGSSAEEGLCELVLGILQATQQTLFAQLVEESNAAECLPKLLASNPTQCSARRIHAVLQLAQYLAQHDELDHSKLELFVQFRHKLATAEFVQSMKQRLTEIGKHIKQTESKRSNSNKDLQESDMKHTVTLIGELHLNQHIPQLIGLLQPGFTALDETISVLGQLKDLRATQPLIETAQRLVDLEERAGQPAVAQPVIESDLAATRSYWLILGALGQLSDPASFNFLSRAVLDFAPDKRSQALRSLIKVCSAYKHHAHGHAKPDPAQPPPPDMTQVEAILKTALTDPSSEVRKTALQGVAELSMSDLLPYVRKNCGSKERSLSEEAFAVFRQLYAQGLSEPVLKELRLGAARTLNSNLRRRYAQLAASLTG
jgi:HEAT repeat protein